MLADIGNGAGPVGLSAVIALASPAAAVVAAEALGLATAWALNRWIPPHPAAAPVPQPDWFDLPVRQWRCRGSGLAP